MSLSKAVQESHNNTRNQPTTTADGLSSLQQQIIDAGLQFTTQLISSNGIDIRGSTNLNAMLTGLAAVRLARRAKVLVCLEHTLQAQY